MRHRSVTIALTLALFSAVAVSRNASTDQTSVTTKTSVIVPMAVKSDRTLLRVTLCQTRERRFTGWLSVFGGQLLVVGFLPIARLGEFSPDASCDFYPPTTDN